MSLHLVDADRSRSPEAQELRRSTLAFGDELDRALHVEAAWHVPLEQRLTCPIHLSWVTDCAHVHVTSKAAA